MQLPNLPLPNWKTCINHTPTRKGTYNYEHSLINHFQYSRNGLLRLGLGRVRGWGLLGLDKFRPRGKLQSKFWDGTLLLWQNWYRLFEYLFLMLYPFLTLLFLLTYLSLLTVKRSIQTLDLLAEKILKVLPNYLGFHRYTKERLQKECIG